MNGHCKRVWVVGALFSMVVWFGGCTSSPEPKPPPELVGLADFHSHQFAHLGFGGKLHTHSTDPADACRRVPPFDASTFHVRDLVLDGLFRQSAEQSKSSQCFPTWSNLAGQQMDEQSLERAWKYGLRLLVVLAVNSEFLCEQTGFGAIAIGGHPQANPPPHARTSTCLDPPAVDAQLRAAHDMEANLDSQAGGPGRGWYRIVTTPAQARDVVASGKLAVVLGVEAANAYGGCRITPNGVVDAIPGIAGPGGKEAAHLISCGNLIPALAGSDADFAQAYFEHYWNQGARHFFLIHNLPGISGGNSLSIPLLHATNNPSRVTSGGFANRVPDIDRVLSQIRPPVTSRACSVDFDGSRCNTNGLSPVGFALARRMADYGAVIDIDHLSLRSKLDVRSDQGLGAQYPLVSSHSGFAQISHGDQNNEDQLGPAMTEDLIKWGSAFGPILHQGRRASDIDTFPPDTPPNNGCGGTTESFAQNYRYIVDKLKTVRRANGRPAYVGVGYGSDFNGLAGWPAPRFDTAQAVVSHFDPVGSLTEAFIGGSNAGRAGLCYLALGGYPTSPPHLTYPFTSRDGTSFAQTTLPWSGRSTPYDISADGLAHVGMVPDFVEELKTIGLSQSELDPLWHGAEAYIRMWEESNAWAGVYTDEGQRGVRDVCRNTRAILVNTDPITDAVISKWKSAVDTLRANQCKGA